MSRRRRRQLSVLVIPDDGSRTLEFKLTYWFLRSAIGALVLLIVLVILGGGFYWQARNWERVAQALKRENNRLRAEVERIEELAQVITEIKRVDMQLRDMLSSNMQLAPAAYSAPPPAYALQGAGDGSEQVVTVLGRSVPRLQEPLDPRWTPSVWPVSRDLGWVTAEFNADSGVLKNQHTGIDIAAPEGSAVYATADGKVVFAGLHETLGQTVAIDHYGVFLTRYSHNATLLVSVEDEVRKGQPVALVGNSGHSSGPHLHYEVLENGRHRDPRQFLP